MLCSGIKNITDADSRQFPAPRYMEHTRVANKVSFKNMAVEIVLPKDEFIDGLQFARSLFCVSYQVGWFSST